MNEHRIGRREAVEVPALWEPTVPLRFRRGWRRRWLKQEAVQVVDLSVTGAGVVGVEQVVLKAGLTMTMDFEHGRGIVRIRRVNRRDDGATYYGVVFVDMEEELRTAINKTIGGRELVDWRWTVNR